MTGLAYAFLSYVRDDTTVVERLHAALAGRGISVWRDEVSLEPGTPFKAAIREAVAGGRFFVACFSTHFNERARSYMNEELLLAVEELRQRPADLAWLIPVRLDDCEIPAIDIGASQTLRDLQRIDLFPDWDHAVDRLGAALLGAPRRPHPRSKVGLADYGAKSAFTAHTLNIRGEASFVNEVSGDDTTSSRASSHVDVEVLNAESISFTNRKR